MIQVYDKYGKIKSSGLPGTGTVTSFSAGNLSPLFNSVVTSPTSTPNISFSKISQAQNLFYASPNGSSGVPTFRALVAADIPTLTGYVPTSRTLTINGVTYDLSADRTWTISSATNLGYTPSPTNGIVTSDTGTDATIPLADGTNAGLLTPAEKTIIAGSQAYADAKVADAIVDGVTTVAPSQNAVFDALALKEDVANKENTLLDNSAIKYPTNNLVKTYLDEDFTPKNLLDNQLAYIIPQLGVATFSFLRAPQITQSGQVGYFGQPVAIQFNTTAVAGTFAVVRGTNITIGTTYFVSKIYFRIITNIAGTRFFNGFSNMFRLAAPTNVEPDTLINSMGVCKLSTSDNLHFMYNDNSGLATTIDCGINFPATSVGGYSYTLEFIRRLTDTDITMTLVRNDGLTTSTVITSNFPTLSQSHAIYITNNATASIASFLHHGAAYNTLT